MILSACLALPAMGGIQRANHDFDSGDARRLAEVSQSSSRTVRVIHAQPLTSSRLDTASTRAVDARRAAQSNVVQRTPSSVYTVTNPTRQRAAQTQQADAATVALREYQQERAIQDRSEEVVVDRFINARPDPVTHPIGNVRAQPSVARVHNGIEPADHRRHAREATRVTYVTRPTNRQVHDLHVAGSGHREYRTETVAVVNRYPSHYYYYYPTYRYVEYPRYSRYSYGACHSYRSYRYPTHYYSSHYSHRRHYGTSYSIGVGYRDGNTRVGFHISGY